MGRGVSSGGGQSSLGYLFGSDEAPKPSRVPSQPAQQPQPVQQNQPPAGVSRNAPPAVVSKPEECVPAADNGVVKLGRNNNNYHRADGQNTGNFITDRPSTKVHSAPGGGSSLGYLFGGN